MSRIGIVCSQCRGAKEVFIKGRSMKEPCGRCEGTGISPDPNAEHELDAYSNKKNASAVIRKAYLVGLKTGSFEQYKQ